MLLEENGDWLADYEWSFDTSCEIITASSTAQKGKEEENINNHNSNNNSNSGYFWWLEGFCISQYMIV